MNDRATSSQSGPGTKPARWAGFRPSVRNVLFTAGTVCLLFSSSVVWAAAAAPARAADDVPGAAQGDSRALRLSSVEGQVRVVQDGQIIADPATANLPLFEGSEIVTGNDGRAEVQMDDGSVARLSPNSSLTFSTVQHRGTGTRTEVVLGSGLAYFELQPSNAEHSLQVSYGPVSFTASSFSVVRIRLDTPPGDLAVFSGNVHLDRGDSLQLDLHSGESLSLDLSDLTRYNLAESIDPDSWDSWNADRDQALNSDAGERTAATSSYLNSENVGMSDLDANGNWYDVPGQGYVWSPFDAQSAGGGWDPYGYGRWVNYPRYGFVWVSGYNWGYTPFQCGLWNYYDNFGWGWAPGTDCNPWWAMGGGGWGYNIGNGPRGYRPPRRPTPIHPAIGGTRSLRAANVVPVDRRPPGATNLALYARPAQSVTIAGHTVEPLRPLAPRQAYDRAAAAYANRPAGSYISSPSHPESFAPSYARPVQSGSRPASSYASHAPSAPASHTSFSGGGGGASAGGGGGHASAGGGGGGGGGGTHR